MEQPLILIWHSRNIDKWLVCLDARGQIQLFVNQYCYLFLTFHGWNKTILQSWHGDNSKRNFSFVISVSLPEEFMGKPFILELIVNYAHKNKRAQPRCNDIHIKISMLKKERCTSGLAAAQEPPTSRPSLSSHSEEPRYVSILPVPGLIAARVTRAPSSTSSIPSEFISIASIEKRPIIFAPCMKIDFSRSPDTLVAMART